MKRYAEYRDSGIEWIGEIPTEWVRGKVGNYYDIQLGKMLQPEKKSSLDTLERYLCAINIGKDGLKLEQMRQMWFSHKDKEQYCIDTNDLLVVEGGDVGTSVLYKGELGTCYIQNALHRVRSDISINKFLMYWLGYLKDYGYIDLICSKATIAHFTKDKFFNTLFLFPPVTIQQSITEHLDRKTAAIDGLIADKQKLVALLQEKRSSIISEAVTKGIDKTTKMKNSGVEWIGAIPQDFTVQKLKFFTEVKDGTHDTPEYVDASLHSVPLITSKDIKNKQITFDNAKHISQEDHYKISKRSNVEIHNVIMPMIGTVGNPAIVMTKDEFSIKNVALFKTSDVITAQYLQYYLDSKLTQYQFDLLNRGGVQQFVSLDILNNLYIVIPADVENMVMVLDSKTTQIDALISDINEQIEKLKEYRQAVISEAVTGKVAV